MLIVKSLAFAILALILGIVGLSFVFSDLGPSESLASRIIIAALFFFLSGLGIGFFNPKVWVISGLTAWGGIFMGGIIVLEAIRRYGRNAFSAQEPPYISPGLVILLIPIGLALAGGYAGKLLSKKRTAR